MILKLNLFIDEVETVNSVNSVSDNESDYLTENSKWESLMNNVKVNNTDNNKYESLSPYRRSLDTKLLHPNTIEEKSKQKLKLLGCNWLSLSESKHTYSSWRFKKKYWLNFWFHL